MVEEVQEATFTHSGGTRPPPANTRLAACVTFYVRIMSRVPLVRVPMGPVVAHQVRATAVA